MNVNVYHVLQKGKLLHRVTTQREDQVMPLPKPRKNESKDDFLDRCMGDSAMVEEYDDNDQRFAICNSQWDEKSTRELLGAIRIHHTSTSDSAWDAGSNEKRLRLDATDFYYRKAYAWQDPDGEDGIRETYRFIHHEISGDGTIGSANIKACQNGIDVLNGAHGGTKIPSTDKSGVHRHLAAHIEDSGAEPTPLKRAERAEDLKEQRVFSTEETELRVVRKDGQPPRIVGYAAVFEKLSDDLGGFQEKIAKGAFARALRTSDARALFNHDPNIILGRESSKTLVLKEDDKGLFMEVFPPDTQLIRDMVLTPIERRDIREQSFGFTVAANGDQWEGERDKTAKVPVRTILDVSRIWDVSPVTFAAYPDTKVALRSKEDAMRTGTSPDGDGGSDGGVEPKHGAPISEKVDFYRGYLKKSREQSREME